MLTVPTGITYEQYMDALAKDNPSHLKITFIDKNITLTDQDIESSGMTIQQIFNGDTDVTMGRSLMASIDVPILKTDRLNGIRWDDEVKVEIGIEYNNTTYWSTIGYFSGTNRFKAVTVPVVAYSATDRMQKFEVLSAEWQDSLEFPMTMREMFHSLCTYVGVPYDDGDALPNIMDREYASNPITSNADVTCRELLSLMAEACCCYARISASGACTMSWFEDHRDYVVTANDQFALQHFDIMQGKTWAELEGFTWEELEDYIWGELGGYEKLFVVDSLTARQQELGTVVYYPSDAQNGNVYLLVDNPYLITTSPEENAAYIKPIYDRLSQFNGYLPSTLDCVGNPLIEAGDIIMVEAEGRQVIVPVFVKTTRWNGSVTDTYEATGNVQREIISSSVKNKLSQGNSYKVQNLISIADDTITVKTGGKLIIEADGTDLAAQSASTTTMTERSGTGGTVQINQVVRKKGIVNFGGRIHSMTTNNVANGAYFTLPEGYRPPATVWVNGFFAVTGSASWQPGIMYVKSDGTVNIMMSNSVTLSDIYFSGTFAI